MKTTIANTETFCRCGVLISVGEAVAVIDGSPVHVGCERLAVNDSAKRDEWRESFLLDEPTHGLIEQVKHEIPGATSIRFDGPGLLPVDMPRLVGQLARVFEHMRSGEWFTLEQIALACECLPTSASARLRQLRLPRLGGHKVLLRRIPDRDDLIYEYRLVLNHAARNTDEERAA